VTKSCFLCGKKLGFFADTFGKYTLSQEKKSIPKGFGDKDVICLDCLESPQKLEKPRKEESKPRKEESKPRKEESKPNKNTDLEEKRLEDAEIGKLDRVFCSSCGNEETSDKRFCSKCGTKITIAEKDDEHDFGMMYVKGEDGFFGRKNVNERKKIIGVLVLMMFVLIIGAGIIAISNDSDDQDSSGRYFGTLDENGKLKYRPYWTVEDEWVARERNGQISTSTYCLNLVKKINYGFAQDADPIFREWVQECLTL